MLWQIRGVKQRRLILRFEGHTDWSQEETELKILKLTGFLDRNKIPYARDIGEYGSFLIEITRPDMVKLGAFLNENLHASHACLHFPYQVLSVNGEGNFELIDYSPYGRDINNFAQSIRKTRSRVSLPKIDPSAIKKI